MKYHIGIGCSFGYGSGNPHELFAKKLGAKFINLSKPGGGNYRIYTEALSWLAINPDKIQDTTFSIGWSGMYRNDLVALQENNEDSISKHWHWTRWRADEQDRVAESLPSTTDIELDHTLRFYTIICALQNLFKTLGVSYIMWNSIDNNIDLKQFHNKSQIMLQRINKTQIDHSHFFCFEKSQSVYTAENNFFLDPSPVGVIEKIVRFPTGGSQYGVRDNHPSREGHLKWFELLWKFCDKHEIFGA